MRKVTVLTHPGRVRPRMEDFAYGDSVAGLAVVADGVGGHSGGDRAARLVAEGVAQALRQQAWLIDAYRANNDDVTGAQIERLVRQAVGEANRFIFEESRRVEAWRGMASTVTLWLDLGERALIAHVGDSRAYLIRGGEALRVTTDHVVSIEGTNRMVAGKKQAKQRVLERAIGNAATVVVDLYWQKQLATDEFMLCSDGLSDMLDGDAELGEIFEQFHGLEIGEVLLDLALSRGGPDNISVAVVGAASQSEQPPVSHGERSDAAMSDWAAHKDELLVLRELAPFAGLALCELEPLRSLARVQQFAAGDGVVPAAEATLDILLSGEAELTTPLGQSRRILPGEVLGETLLTHPAAGWPYQVRVAKPLTLVRFSVEGLERLMVRRGRLSTAVLFDLLRTASRRAFEPGFSPTSLGSESRRMRGDA